MIKLHAEKCPVCNGEGRITEVQHPSGTSAVIISKPCNGCGGRGWIEVNDNYPCVLPCTYPNCPYVLLPQYYYPLYGWTISFQDGKTDVWFGPDNQMKKEETK